jgi:hypothetical protein
VKVAVWRPSEPLAADEWCRRLRESDVDVVAVLDIKQDGALESLLRVMGGGDLASAFRPVSDALKVVAEGMVIGSIEREGVVELVPPFAFRVEAALAVMARMTLDLPVDLLAILSARLAARPFSSDRSGDGA